jgi:hypothetical protein
MSFNFNLFGLCEIVRPAYMCFPNTDRFPANVSLEDSPLDI